MSVVSVFRNSVLTAVVMMLTASCDVHQFPEEYIQENVEVRLHLEYDTELPDYMTVTYGDEARRRSRALSPSELYDIRYTVSFYKYTPEGDVYDRHPVYTRVMTRDGVGSLDADLTVLIPPAHYRVMVWTDYVAYGSESHLFYNTDDFSSVSLMGEEHIGSNDFREGYCGDVDLDLRDVSMPAPTLYAMPESPVVDATIASGRPMAKFRVITTDLDKFLERSKGSKADPEDFRVVIRYPGYMPSVFNMHTGKPSDSSTGKSFDGSLRRLSDGNVELGYDYVLVNGSEASVEIAIDVYDADQSLLSSTGVITVPLIRSKLTTLIGEFLTVSTQGGVSVDPTYDGEFNIFIP